jgi:Zn-dependent metalloprotease
MAFPKGGIMLKIKVLICLIVLGFASSAVAFMPFDGAQDRAVSLAYYDQDPVFMSNLIPLSASDPHWNVFLRQHGRWAVQANVLTGIVHQAWGDPIYVGIPKNEEDASNIAESFLESNADLLKISPSELVLTRSIHRGHDWFVDYKQQYRGIDVFGSRTSVRISDRGNIIMLQCDYLPGINISISPALSESSARLAASNGLLSSIQTTSESNLIIFPIPIEIGFDYHLAYQTEVTTDQPARWFAVVDAATGEVLYRKNLVDYFTVDGYVNGMIYPTTPFDSLVVRPFEAQNVNVTGLATLLTDSIGFFSAEVADSLPRRINLSMAGSFVNVHNSQGSQAALVDTVTPGETLYVNWTSARSRNDERNTYYHVNVVHDFFKSIDPDFTGLDFAVPANVNLNQTCNAYWDGASVNFFMAGGGCTNTGEIADVIYHEYGHGITDFQYRPSSPSGAQHEGWSDYTAATITNQPLIGRGFYSANPDQYLRTVDNTNHYPEDWQGESHNDGLIVAGALWDLREALAPRVRFCDSLFHFARYGLSSNYQDYLIDMLEYDDDDDTLFNGTPHWDQITTAFYLHGIMPVDVISIVHNPIGDTLDTTHPYAITASVNFTFTPPNPDSIFVCYRSGNSGPFLKSQMTRTANPGEYSGAIPAQSLGTLVEYYISLADRHGRVVTSPITAPLPTYFFVVGQLTIQRADSLERSSGWIVGTQEDDATTGIWTRVDPIGTYADSVPNAPFQPEDDHTPDPGIYCYITGQQPVGDPNNGTNDVDGGVTSLTTPSYDLSTYDNPVIEYFRWFATNRNVDDTFEVQISSDDGVNWTPVEILTTMADSWQRSRFLVDQVIGRRSQIKLRFSACDRGSGSIVEGGVDDLTFYSFTPTSISNEPGNGLPIAYALHENYPNPFNGRTEISYDLPRSSDVTLTVFDIAGRLVYQSTLLNQTAGKHSITWDSHQAGRELASGVYLYRLQASDFTASRKMLLLK